MVIAMLAVGCRGSREELEVVKRMLNRQVFQLENDVGELERRIHIAEGASTEEVERKGAICRELSGLREKLMTKWDAFLWDRISLASDDNLTWTVDTFPEEGKRLEAIGDRIEATKPRVQSLCSPSPGGSQ